MKTYEELKGMTHEDLVRHVQELQESVESTKKDRDYWYREYKKVKERFDTFRDAVKSVVTLVD